MGCNYLSLPLIAASGTTLLNKHYQCCNQIYTFEPLHALWDMIRWLVGQCFPVLAGCDKLSMAIQNSFRLGCMYNLNKNLGHVWPVNCSVKRLSMLTFPVSRAFLNYQVNPAACYLIAFSTAAAPIIMSPICLLHTNTIKCHSYMVQFIMISYTELQWQQQNMNQTWNSQ